MMSLFREQKLLVVLLLISLLVLGAGVFMIQITEEQAQQHTEQQAVQQLDEQEKAIAAMNLMADIAEKELKAQQQQPQSVVQGVSDIKPQESIDRVAALNGRVPDVGSDDWCEVMMVKDAKDWTVDEQSLFAKHCL